MKFKYLLIFLFCTCVIIPKASAQSSLSKLNPKFSMIITPSTHFMVMPTRLNSYYTVTGNSYFEEGASPTVGLNTRLLLFPLRTNFFSYAYLIERSEGWLGDYTSSLKERGHHFNFSYKKVRLIYERTSIQRLTSSLSVDYRDASSVATDIFDSRYEIDRDYLALEFPINKYYLELGIIREFFTNVPSNTRWNDTALGGKVVVTSPKRIQFFAEVIPIHPMYGRLFFYNTSNFDLENHAPFVKIGLTKIFILINHKYL